ncbi:MAG: hypothetical protein ACR2N2_08355 [Acidimicrobiia bacterium]
MSDSTRLAEQQLARMRGMTGLYHKQFFRDITATTLLTLALFVVAWWQVPQAFLLIPVVALIGAVQTAFDSSYLIFARWYAAYLEGYLNDRAGERILVAASLESTYLFPLGSRKVVTIPLGGGFSWFSLVTVLYTVIGATAYLFGLVLGWDVLSAASATIQILYLVPLIGLTVAVLGFGMWWFVGGEGERRLEVVLDTEFGRKQ